MSISQPAKERDPAKSRDPLRQPGPAGQPQAQPDPGPAGAAEPAPADWASVIWREWRHTGDAEYARHLFELVADEPVDSRTDFLITTGVRSFYGALLGLLPVTIALLAAPEAWWGQVWPLWIVAGAALGGLSNLLFPLIGSRRAGGARWLTRLTLNLSPSELALTGAGLGLMAGGVFLVWILTTALGLANILGVVGLTILVGLVVSLSGIGWLLRSQRQTDPTHLHQFRSLFFWWRDRPRRAELEAALRQASQARPDAAQGWAELLRPVDERRSGSLPLAKQVERLKSFDWRERFEATRILATAGGEAVDLLRPLAERPSSSLRGRAIRLLQAIAQETSARLAPQLENLLCPACLARLGPHRLKVDDEILTYYGCRHCRQSREVWSGELVVVLDETMTAEIEQKEKRVRVNWLRRRELFDFDQVEIIQATDEAIERFAVQIGNDTDPWRQPRYGRLRCCLAPTARLSENSRRVLGHIFAVVERGPC